MHRYILSEPASSPRRTRKGVYESYTYRGLGRREDRSVRIVLLDTRYSMNNAEVRREEAGGGGGTAVCTAVCATAVCATAVCATAVCATAVYSYCMQSFDPLALESAPGFGDQPLKN
jgi:hypothetical protein